MYECFNSDRSQSRGLNLIRKSTLVRYLVSTISLWYSSNLNSFDRYSSSWSHPGLSRFHRTTQIGKSIVIRRFADSAQRRMLQVARAVLRGVTGWKWRYTGIISNILLQLEIKLSITLDYYEEEIVIYTAFRSIVFSLSLKPREISSWFLKFSLTNNIKNQN